MALLNIHVYPDPILKQPAEKVTEFGEDLGKLLDNMYQTMISAAGIGLAAPQVGISRRIAVIDVSEERDQRLEIINPVITEVAGKIPSEEGCLSIPGYRDTIKRSEIVTITAQDRSGEQFEIKADGLLAICLQHEIDHLDGILFTDHLSRLKRELFKRWHRKQSAASER